MTYSLGDIIILIMLISAIQTSALLFWYHSMFGRKPRRRKKPKSEITEITEIYYDDYDDGR